MFDLAFDSNAPTTARSVVGAACTGLPAETIDDVVLMVSEIVTNAIRHGCPDVVMTVQLEPPVIRVSVSDGGRPLNPSLHPVDDTATGGRGLHIVDSLASAWGVTDRDSAAGKTVWFRIDPLQPAS